MQENLQAFGNEFLSPSLYYAPMRPRRNDPFAHLIVQKNLEQFRVDIGRLDIFLPYAPRRNDPFGAIIVQRNLDHLVKQL